MAIQKKFPQGGRSGYYKELREWALEMQQEVEGLRAELGKRDESSTASVDDAKPAKPKDKPKAASEPDKE